LEVAQTFLKGLESKMIECSLLEMKKYSFFVEQGPKVKYGRYLSSFFHNIPGFGKKVWIVGANILVDYDEHIANGKTPEEVIEECIKYLNTPPKSKYGKRRKRKPLFGKFEEKPHKFYLKEKDNKKYIQALLLVPERKRRCFWGEGPQMHMRRK